MVLAGLLASCAGQPPAPPPGVAPEIATLRVAMDPTDADVLFKKDPDDLSSFAVTVDPQGPHPLQGRIEVKGGFTREFAKKAVLIKLKHGDSWRGDPRIVLNSEDTDPSMMREYLTYDLLHSMHALVPSTQYTRLYINDQPRGLFVRIGWIGPGMFEHAGYGADGELYEPRADFFCGDLSPASVEDASHCYAKRGGSDLTFDRLRQMVKALAAAPKAGFAAFVERTFDMDSVINWIVMNAVVSNSDTYNKNYFLYYSRAKDKWVIVPFDFDLTYGRTFDPFQKYPNNILNKNFTYYYPLLLGAPNLLRDRVLETPALMDRVRGKVEEIVDGPADPRRRWSGWGSPTRMEARIAHLREIVKPALSDDPFVGTQTAAFEEETHSLIHYAHARAQYLERVIIGHNDWVRDTGEAQLLGSELDVSDGFGYLLATLDLHEPGSGGLITAEVRRGRPELIPPGLNRDACIQRTWLLTAKDAPGPVVADATVEYLQENAHSHELGPLVYNEYRLKLYARDARGWRSLPTRTDTLANALTAHGLQLPVDDPLWLVACDNTVKPNASASAHARQ